MMPKEQILEQASPTRSLRASANPQARMQELLRQDVPPSKVVDDAAELPVPQATALPESSTTSSAVAQVGSSEETQHDSSAVAQMTVKTDMQKPKQGVGQKPDKIKVREPSRTASSDPVREAMLGMLSLPYPEDMAEGAMTVTSVKIPKPIWERLEYARTLTKKDKQDIIADALRIYFELIVEGGLEKGGLEK